MGPYPEPMTGMGPIHHENLVLSTSTSPPASILVVDDHGIVREGIGDLIARQDGLEVVGLAATGEQAVALEKQLSEPRQLAAVIGEKEPKSKIPPPKVAVEDFGSGNWSGVHVTMKGGAKLREVNGYVVSQRNKAGATFIVVIAANGDIAKRLVAEATQ